METPSAVRAETTATHAGTSILVVDDDDRIRRLIQCILEERNNCASIGAANVTEALTLLAESPFDAVITDLRMPGESGLDLTEQISKLYPDTPVLLLTGVEDVRTAVQALKTGASDYLLKPLDSDQLIFSLNRAIEGRRLRQELERYRRHLEEMVAERTEGLRKALEEVRATTDATIEALATALEFRDDETEGHSRRVSQTCRVIAQAMGVEGQELTTVTYGAYLHDIGKIAVPDQILRKPAGLTPDEQAIMRTHVEIGYKMLRNIRFLTGAAEIVRAHHEAFDGSGYPRKLRGDQIPLGARIFAIADTMDAITSDRPYRRARPFVAARQEIIRCTGTQFDPQVVNVFLSLPRSSWILSPSAPAE